jgi:hypothetical protein
VPPATLSSGPAKRPPVCSPTSSPCAAWRILSAGSFSTVCSGGVIEPMATRQLIRRLEGVPSLLTVDAESFVEGIINHHNLVALIRETVRGLRRASLSFRGLTPTDADTWDLGWMNLRSTALGGRRYRPGQVEASAIRQPWLREVIKTWATTVSLDSGRFKRVFAACVVASDASLHGWQDFDGPAEITRHEFESTWAAAREILDANRTEETS